MFTFILIITFLFFWFIIVGLSDRTPKVGDKVKVAVGFSNYKQEGVVSRVCEDSDGGKYCWIERFNNRGEFVDSFTASFSYCVFEYL